MISITEPSVNMKILIVGDSLVFGRRKHGIGLTDTWPGILASCGHEVHIRARGGSGIDDVAKELETLYHYYGGSCNEDEFDICIIQCGIVDATPRLISKNQSALLLKLGLPSHLINRVNSARPVIKVLGQPNQSSQDFFALYGESVDSALRYCSQVVAVPIAPPFHYLVKNCGDFANIVAEFNRRIKDLPRVDCIDISFDGSMFLDDGHHLNKKGHKIIASSIFKSSIFRNHACG